MIACVTIPYFAAAVEGRADAALRDQPLVIGGQPWEPRPTYAYSRDVARRGVRPGMALRQAHLLSPDARFLPPAEPAYDRAAGELVDLLTDFTPRIVPESLWQPAVYWRGGRTADGRSLPARYAIDLESLPAAEGVSLSQAMGRAVRDETRLSAAIGLAPHRFTAQVAAALARPDHLRAVEPDDEAAFLAEQSLQFLPFDREAARRLRLLGIRTLGQFAALPLPELQEQFGPAIIPLYRLARGEADVPLQPLKAAQMETVNRLFDYSLTEETALATLCRQVAAELAERLAVKGVAGRRVTMAWETEDPSLRPSSVQATGSGQGGRGDIAHFWLREPTADADRLTALLSERLLAVTFSAGLVGLTVTLGELTAVRPQQLCLFDDGASDGGCAFDHLVAKYGDIFYRPAPTAERRHPLVERRFTLHPLDGDGPPLA